MPPKSSAAGLRDILLLTLLLPLATGALQQQPAHNAYPNHPDNPAVAQAYNGASGESLHTALSGQRGHRDTDVDDGRQYRQQHRTHSHSNERALATFSPAESDPAGPAPPAYRPSSQSTGGLSSRQPARSLQDWQVEDIVLLATVDGMVYARDRRTGAHKWAIGMNQSMVETVYHRHNRSLDEKGQGREDPLWIIEPSQDGSIYFYLPGMGGGMQKLERTVKDVVELGPYADDGTTAHAYTAEKRSFLYHINAADGNVIKMFGPAGSTLNDDYRCKRFNALDPLDEEECETESVGTLILGRTEYTLGIQDRNTGEQISTIKYFEWVPNNRDHDLRSKYTTTMDKRYVYTKYDGTIFGMDLAPRNDYNPNPIYKPIYRQKLPSPVARIFDIVRPSDDPSPDANLVLLPQPVSPSPNDGMENNFAESVWVNCTEDGSWYALSESKYPTVTEGAASAMYSNDDIFINPPPISLPMSKQDRQNFMGVHQISPMGRTRAPGLIEPPEIPHIDPPPPDEHGALIEAPSSAWDPYLPSLKSLITFLMFGLLACGVVYQQQGGNFKRKVTLEAAPDGAEVSPAAEQEKENEPPPMIRESEPAKELIFPREEVTAPERTADAVKEDEGLEKVESNEVAEAAVAKEGEEVKPKKKATRGKRGGKKQKEKEAQQAEARAKRANSEAGPEAAALQPASAVISVAASESPQVSGPLQINSLIIHTDKVIGQGSCGTSVFEGSFEGRDVAVKRMLSQYYDLAAQEVSFLQQSDDHPNVIRYFCQQKDDHFLYIAVELCQASLFEVWDPEKARTEARQQQLKALKLAILQDIPTALEQLAAGLSRLHDLRIIHRDIKPQNILVAFPKRNSTGTRLVISDFGLGKNLPENVSTLVDPTGNAGTSGWKAPELISIPRDSESKHSQNNSHTGTNSESLNGGGPSGVKRAADIFSLGCLFFWVLTDGTHPYEDEMGWQQLRELNIKKDLKKMDVLARWSDAYEPMQLITSMLEHAPENRPTALQVLNHPFFWSPEKRLAFLCDCSDHFEREPRGTYEDDYAGDSPHLALLESRAEEVIGHPVDFLSKLDRHFVDTLGRQRKYSGYRLLDLLRALRNKKNHYEDMPEDVKRRVGNLPEGYLNFWSVRFPRLLMACYEVVHECGLERSARFRGFFVKGK